MKKLIYGIGILTLLTSCKQQVNKTVQESQQLEKTNLITDPNQFIGKYKAKAMILGVFHFSNPALDSYKREFSFDILKKNRQRELDTLLKKIVKYKPTKILVEWNRIKSDSILNVRYQEFLSNNLSIKEKSSEIYQIAFKLAKKLNHNRIYASDSETKWFGVKLDWDNYDSDNYLKSNRQYKKSNRYDYNSFYKLKDSLKTTQSLTEHLIYINNPKDRLKDHQAYLTEVILEGAGDNYLGADSVGKWYSRNLRIFANAYDLTDFNKEEKLLLIYGSGHVWQLRHFFKDSPDFDYVEPNEYLKQ